jgi:murein L,D-transpeptidase YafK
MTTRLTLASSLLLVLLTPAACARADRSHGAMLRRGAELRRLLAGKGLPFPPREIFIRAFKRERVLEVWAREGGAKFQQVLSLPFCAASGELGPKRRSGDGQVPEGFYHLDRFNPHSSFYLSLGLDYPNAADRRQGAARDLGGDIFLHGGCASIGCIAVTDAGIEPVYLLAVGARSRGQRQIPVHIFPARLDDSGVAWLRANHAGKPALLAFWDTLRPGYQHFERQRSLPRVRVTARGAYQIEASRLAAR